MSSYQRLSGSGLSSGGGGGGGGTTIPAGSVSAPGLPVVGSASTGLYSANANELDVAANGVLVASFLSTGPAFTGVLTSTTSLGFPGKSQIQSSADGFIGLYNSSGAGFTGLRFGGLTASYPMWKASGAGFAARVADDTADAALSASSLTLSGNITVPAAASVVWSSGGSLLHPSDGIYNLTDNAADNNVMLQIGTGTTSMGSAGTYGITLGTRGNASAANISKIGAGPTMGFLTGNGNWNTVTAGNYGLNGSSGATQGITASGSSLVLNAGSAAALTIDNTQAATFASTVKVQAAATLRAGSAATPNSVVTGNVGDIYLSTNGGAATTLWVKESGAATNTGWVAK